MAQVAVFAEGESMYHVRKSAGIATVCLSDMRRTLAEMGAPYDLYSMGDLAACDPEQYRLIILLNNYDISSLPAILPSLQTHGRKNSPEQISKAVGMGVLQSGESHGSLVYQGKTVENTLAAPYFSIADETAKVYACFADGTPAVAGTEDGKSIYAAMPFLPSELLRDLVRNNGIFIYSKDPRVYTYVNADAVCVYNATDGDAVVFVPDDGVYTDQITKETFTATGGKIQLPQRKLRAYLLTRDE